MEGFVMRKEIREIKQRHRREHNYQMVDELNQQDWDDVSYAEWLTCHQDRATLLAEINRLYSLLRRRRRS
jgi:hypothetical protein